jgi:hypothetical protein
MGNKKKEIIKRNIISHKEEWEQNPMSQKREISISDLKKNILHDTVNFSFLNVMFKLRVGLLPKY